jgi:general secretion pathway protein J
VRGFTLVEVLVALAIMAVLAAMSWQGIDAMIRAKAINQENMERTLRLATVLGQWEQDLLQVHDQPGTPPLLYDGASLRLVRRTPEGVQVVVWALRDGLLQRWVSPSVTDGTAARALVAQPAIAGQRDAATARAGQLSVHASLFLARR